MIAPAHLCASGKACKGTIVDDDGHRKPRETQAPDDLCDACLNHTTQRVEQLPEQWIRLHAMIGERHAGVDVNIRRPKPSGTVPLNLHVDTLLGDILETVTTAAEVVADKMNMDDPTIPHQKDPVPAPPWASSPTQEPGEQVQRCCRIVAPNLHVLMSATGVGGRDPDDRAIDVMTWAPNGLIHMSSTTTGIKIVKQLDHLGALAYFTLGMTRARTHRDLPCTRCRARTVGRWAGSEYFDCSTCGSQFPEDALRRQDKILLELHRRGLEVQL